MSPLLQAPIVPTLARLAAPGIALALFQTAVSVADTHFIDRLGTDSLAGLALVFPMLMLLMMTSAGAMGGGVSSAVARALGAGNQDAARKLVAHAFVIALGGGLVFILLLLGFGRGLYGLLGGRGESLEQALAYSQVIFGGAVLVWIANTLASLLRGSGNTLAPALAFAGTALVQIPLSGALTLGWGPFPRWGIAGAATASLLSFGAASLVLAVWLWNTALRPQRWPAMASACAWSCCRSRSCSRSARRWWSWWEPTSAPGRASGPSESSGSAQARRCWCAW